MSHIRTTEQIAPETLAGLLAQLARLTTNGATTAELEEALLASKAYTRALFEWLAARYCTQAAARKAYIPTETPAEAEELDRIEQAHPTPGGLHPIFEELTAPMRRPA